MSNTNSLATGGASSLERVSQNIFEKRINVRQMATYAKMAQRLDKTVFFLGGAGLGKSNKIYQVADEMFPNTPKHLRVCEVRLSDKEPTDIAGIQVPMTVKDGVSGKEVVKTFYAVPDFWPQDPDWEGFIFLDELTNTQLSTLHSGYQVVLDHIAGAHRLPKKSVYICAGNRDTDNGGTTEMPAPFINRCMVIEVDYDLQVWIEDFAVPFKLHPILIGFLKEFPDYFYTGDVANRSNCVFASPRQHQTVSDVLYEYDEGIINIDEAEIAIQGLIGEGVDTLLLAYYERASELPKVEEIFDGTRKDHQLDRGKNDLVYVLAQTCLLQLDKDVMDMDISDDKFIERVGNFLTFMHKNHYEYNKDTLIALMIGIFRAGTGQDASLLRKNPKRSAVLVPTVLQKVPAVGAVVQDYMKRYQITLQDFS